MTNEVWLEVSLEKCTLDVSNKKCKVGENITTLKARIDKLENIEEEFSGPKQKELKEALKKLGDVARYHGGDLQGKQVQKLLDNARNEETYELLECIKDDKEEYEKFKEAIKILSEVSDSLRLEIDKFDDIDLSNIREICEKWGKFWTKAFPHRNITPKGHTISFVLPASVEHLKSFHRFYKMEQVGEEIHAEMNDINRKAWVIRNHEQRLWAMIYRYELRNQSKTDIVEPVKRLFKNPTRKFGIN